MSVNKVAWTCRVQPEFDGMPIDGVPIQPTYLTSEGGGSYHMPEVNTIVWLCQPSTQNTPFIMGSAASPRSLNEGDDSEDPNDFRQARPVLNDGDQLLASSGTGRVILRRGGVLELGASESAKRVYIPLTNLIREFSQNYVHESGGSSFSMLCRDDDERFGTEVTPSELQLKVKEFCEDELPIFDMRVGRIQVEDDQRVVHGIDGEVVYSVNINNRYRVWIDKRGNYQVVHFGATTESYVGPRTTRHDKSLGQIVRGTLNMESGARSHEVERNDRLTVGRDREVSIGGNLTEIVQGSTERTVAGPVTEDVGTVDRTVRGDSVERVLNNEESTIAGGKSLSVGGASTATIGGTKNEFITNASANANAWEVVVANGKASIHNILGKNVISVGPTPALATIKIVQAVSGTLLISSSLGAVELEVNATGIQLKTVAGEISIDNLGTVNLGPGPGRGNVITTATMPADLTTGVPTIGTSSVRAGGIPAPGPAVTPSSFVSDPTV